MRKGYKPAGKLGSGNRFKAVAGSVQSEYVSKGFSPKKAAQIGGAVAYKVGVKAHGKKTMTKLAKAGK